MFSKKREATYSIRHSVLTHILEKLGQLKFKTFSDSYKQNDKYFPMTGATTEIFHYNLPNQTKFRS